MKSVVYILATTMLTLGVICGAVYLDDLVSEEAITVPVVCGPTLPELVESVSECKSTLTELAESAYLEDTVFELTLTELVESVSPTVVYIKAPYWSGSGVIVSESRVLTARHIIAGADEWTITDSTGKVYESTGCMIDPNDDVGIIFVDGKFDCVADIGDSDTLRRGDAIFAIGSPLGYKFFNEVCDGIVSGLNRDVSYFGNSPVITTNLDGNPGNSGCPVFNDNGEVIGILVGTAGGVNPIAVVVSINLAKHLIDADLEHYMELKK